MNENKRERRRIIRQMKRQLRYLLKLKKMNYNSSYVIIDWLIDEAKNDLKMYGVEVKQ